MDVREALYTTRAMRRVKPDPVPEEIQLRILDAAIRAPSGGNSQGWRFLIVDDSEQIAKIGSLYSDCIDMLWETIYKDQVAEAAAGETHRGSTVHARSSSRSPGRRRTLRTTRCCCLRSTSSIRPVDQSFRPFGARCWLPGPMVWVHR